MVQFVDLSRPIKVLYADLVKRYSAFSLSASLDIQVLLANAFNEPRAWIIAHPEAQLNPQQITWLQKALSSYETHVPLPYIIGKWEFYGLEFKVTQDVLIPRPETELLIDFAIAWVGDRRLTAPKPIRAIDVGTGSGCIPISISVHHSRFSFTACDISLPALQLAQQNAFAHQVHHRMNFVQSDLLTPFSDGRFDLICANLPYIPEDKLPMLDVYKREPTLALDGGKDGLVFIRRMLIQAQTRINPGGLILAEIEESQGKKIKTFAKQLFTGAEVSVIQDYAAANRLLHIELPPA